MQFVRIPNETHSQQMQVISQPHWQHPPTTAQFHAQPQYQQEPQTQNLTAQIDEIDNNKPKSKKIDKEEKKARNRIAAKKWRDKKDGSLYSLEAINDKLREQALDLRKQSLSLIAENRILEKELHFFQNFMTRIMNVGPK